MSDPWDDITDFISDYWIELHEYDPYQIERLKAMVCPVAERDAAVARAERGEAWLRAILDKAVAWPDGRGYTLQMTSEMRDAASAVLAPDDAALLRQSAGSVALATLAADLTAAHANYTAMDTAWNEEFERLWPRLEAAAAMADAIDDDTDPTPRCREARDAYRALTMDNGDAPYEDTEL